MRIKALERLGALDFPPELVEVLVAEGRCPSRQRNRAVEQASGDILCFLDDDSVVSPDYVSRLLKHFDDPLVGAVGGPSLTPSTDSVFQRAIGQALAGRFGGGGVRNRYRQTGAVRATTEQELILCNLSFRRADFAAGGGLDERLYPNEENELLDRLHVKGCRLIHDPELAIYRSQRATYRALLRQFLNYGRGRAEQTAITCRIPFGNLVPLVFLLYLVSLVAVHRTVYYLPLLCYLILLSSFAFAAAFRTREPRIGCWLLAVYPTMHLGYAAGLVWGGWRVIIRSRRVDAADVMVRCAKRFTDSYPAVNGSALPRKESP